MVTVVVFKKPDQPGKAAEPERAADGAKPSAEIVLLPGIDMKALADAWGFRKRTGRSHNPPTAAAPTDDD